MDLGFLVTFLDGNRISIVNTGLEEPELVEKLDFDNDPLTTQCIFRGIFFIFEFGAYSIPLHLLLLITISI